MSNTKLKRKCLLSCYADRELTETIDEIAKKESLSRSLIMRIAMKRLVKCYEGGNFNVL